MFQNFIKSIMWSTLLSVVLVINELMASNAGEVMSPATNFDSWIELYNSGDSSFDLSGYGLSNENYIPLKWTFPKNTMKP